MSLSSVELWQRISSAGLAPPMICRSWAAEALQDLQPSDATNASKILQQLVKLGRLTDYQADLIAGNRQGEFKRGGWTLLRPVTVPLWDGWYEAVKSPSESPTWLRWLSSQALTEYSTAGPSLPRGLRLAQLKGPHLQTVYVPELIEKQLQLRVQPLVGVPLTTALQQGANGGLQATEIIRQIAEALRPLHMAEIAHGRVFPDRVFWDETAGATLAQDPICCHTGSLDPKAIGVIRIDLKDLSPAQFMAPEFLAPGQLPSPSSDVYSLGCLWWWLITGKPLVSGSTRDKQLARQAEASIALPKECQLPPPIVRCLQHCLAKNLPARFVSSEQLCRALDAALAAVGRGPVARQRVVKPPTIASIDTPTAAPPVVAKPAPAAALKAAQTTGPPNPKPISAAVNPPVSEPSKSPTVVSPLKPTPVKSTIAKAPLEKVAGVETQATSTQRMAATPVLDHPKTATFDASQMTGPLKQQVSESQAIIPPINLPKPAPPKVESSLVETPKAQNPTEQSAAPKSESRNAPALRIPKTVLTPGAKPVGRKKVKRKPANNWALPVMGGLGAVCVLLGILIASGVMKTTPRKPTPRPAENTSDLADNTPVAREPARDSEPADPRLGMYRIVAEDKSLLWVPPSVPKPISLDLLPPGGQMFVTLRPNQLLNKVTGKSLISALNESLSPLLEQASKRAGVTFDTIDHLTVAFYAENEVPMTCLRVKLATPQALSTLRSAWGSPAEEKVGSLTILTNADGDSYFMAEQPLADVQSVSEFSVGPTGIMRETAEMQGAAGPLVSHLQKLWQSSDADADLSVLVATPFLFSDGKAILAWAPKRLENRLRETLARDTRAALIQTRFEPSWYFEAQLVGPSEREAPRLNELLRQKISGVSAAVEGWFVAEQPHPYWRSLAIRFPQMLRVFSDQTRYGIENGAAIANTYLPPEAATNILLSSWVASQDGATLASDLPPGDTAAAATGKPLTMEEYLARPIKLSFDQEPIETALRLVGDEANANLSAGTPQLRFALDGGAFERAGITRNQQLKDFKHVDLPMRDALTAIAKRGNPVTTVKDTREEDQRLIWVVRDDPEHAGKQMISLTTRVEANANKIPLPVEFAPPQ